MLQASSCSFLNIFCWCSQNPIPIKNQNQIVMSETSFAVDFIRFLTWFWLSPKTSMFDGWRHVPCATCAQTTTPTSNRPFFSNMHSLTVCIWKYSLWSGAWGRGTTNTSEKACWAKLCKCIVSHCWRNLQPIYAEQWKSSWASTAGSSRCKLRNYYQNKSKECWSLIQICAGTGFENAYRVFITFTALQRASSTKSTWRAPPKCTRSGTPALTPWSFNYACYFSSLRHFLLFCIFACFHCRVRCELALPSRFLLITAISRKS